MTTFVISGISDKTRGMLTRYMYEPAPYVFTNTLSKRQRDELIRYIRENNAEVDLLVIYEQCGQAAFETYGNPKRFSTQFEDVHLISRKIEADIISYVYAKPDKKLLDHMLETGWVAKAFLEEGFYKGQAGLLAKALNVPIKTVVDTVCFLVAVHDIGKAHPLFQTQNMENPGTSMLKRLGMIPKNLPVLSSPFRHEQYSKVILQEYLTPFLKFPKRPEREAEKYGNLVLYHHQNKSTNYSSLDAITGFDMEEDWKSRIIKPILEIIGEEFPFTEIVLEPYSDRFFHFTLGLLMLSDRISSSML